jgi:protein-S-isoprenylcysteine O-methyltransferase Ste14
MPVLVVQAFGALVFLVGSLWLGSMTQRRGDAGMAETASRLSHLLFWAALVLPGMVGLIYPGLRAYDRLLGVPSLSPLPVWLAAGVVLLCVGLGLLVMSNRSLVTKGRGAAAFLLTARLVTDGLYGRTRNPMSLGFYACCAGIGMITGSMTVTLGALLIIVPIHIVSLKQFEERELELRYGQSYVEYRRRVPFLVPRMRRAGRKGGPTGREPGARLRRRPVTGKAAGGLGPCR